MYAKLSGRVVSPIYFILSTNLNNTVIWYINVYQKKLPGLLTLSVLNSTIFIILVVLFIYFMFSFFLWLIFI